MSNPNATDSVTPPRWQRRPEARPEEILDAAQKVFGDSGFARAKVDDVARLAGVSKGTLYLYFDSKETLFREVVRAKIVALLAESEALVEAHSGSCRDLLVQLITGMFHSMRDHEIVKISRVAQAEFASFPELAQFYARRTLTQTPIEPEDQLEQLIAGHEVDEVVFAYSDVTHEHVMHIASRVLAAGASFRLISPAETMLTSTKPSIAICAVRTGSGKSQTTRHVAALLRREVVERCALRAVGVG